MTKTAFLKFYPDKPHAEECYDAIEKALKAVGIYSDKTMIGALATVRTEVGRDYLPIEEIGTGEQYEGRDDLGNSMEGYGARFKG